MYENDNRIVLTLDAGGTNFIFSAIQGNKAITPPFHLPAVPNDINGCLDALLKGFNHLIGVIGQQPTAISFAFPGPADYKHGIIGDLPNFPAFRGGIALGPFLEHHFKLPVFIENDGNLFAYGEALSGALPLINHSFQEQGNPTRYQNLIGLTLGTGFGAGVVVDKQLLNGDNNCGGDVWLMRNKKYPDFIAEESVSIRGILRIYKELSHEKTERATPKEIYDIAEGKLDGNPKAAIAAFHELGEIAGNVIAGVLNIVDGIVVIGGGLFGAEKYILPSILTELHSELHSFRGTQFPCVQMRVFNWENPAERDQFLQSETQTVYIPRSNETVPYQHEKKTAIMRCKNDTSHSIMLGAYAFALNNIDSAK